jgi:hypothetical protein
MYDISTGSVDSKIDSAISRSHNEVHVIGHSLGGFYVSRASNRNHSDNVSFYTINSPYATQHDNAKDYKTYGDPFNFLQLFTDVSGFYDAEFSEGGHSVTEGQDPIDSDPSDPTPDPTNIGTQSGTPSGWSPISGGGFDKDLVVEDYTQVGL